MGLHKAGRYRKTGIALHEVLLRDLEAFKSINRYLEGAPPLASHSCHLAKEVQARIAATAHSLIRRPEMSAYDHGSLC